MFFSIHSKFLNEHFGFIISEEHLNEQQIDLLNPIHISLDEFHNLNNRLS